MNISEISAWSEVESQPWFAELTPEEKTDSLNKWKGDMMQFAKDPREKFAIAATSKAKARSFLGEEMPDDPIADAIKRRQKDLEDIGSRYDAFSKGELEEPDEDVLALNDTIKGNTPYSVVGGRLFVSPSLIWDKAAYEKAVNEAPVDEDEKILTLESYDGAKERASESLVNTLGYTDEAFREFAAEGFGKGKTNTQIVEEWKAQNKLPDGLLGSVQGVGRQAYFGLRSGLSGLERAVGGLGAFFGSESAQQYAEESGKESASYMARRLGEGPEFLGELASGATSIVPTIAAGAAMTLFTEGAGAPAAASIIAGALQSAGAAQADSYEFYREQGRSHADALAESRVDGLVSGIITGAVTKYAGILGSKLGIGKGIEGLFSGPVGQFASKITQKELSAALKEGAKTVGGSMLQEGFEEGADQLAQGVYERIQRDPTKTLPEIMAETLAAAKVGAVLGGAAEGAKLGISRVLNRAKFVVSTTEDEEALRAKFEVPVAAETEVEAAPEVQQVKESIVTAVEVADEVAPVAPATSEALKAVAAETADETAGFVAGSADALIKEAASLASETAPVSETILSAEAPAISDTQEQPQPPQGQPVETQPDALPITEPTPSVSRQERPEMGLQQVGEGNAQPEEVAATSQEAEEVTWENSPEFQQAEEAAARGDEAEASRIENEWFFNATSRQGPGAFDTSPEVGFSFKQNFGPQGWGREQIVVRGRDGRFKIAYWPAKSNLTPEETAEAKKLVESLGSGEFALNDGTRIRNTQQPPSPTTGTVPTETLPDGQVTPGGVATPPVEPAPEPTATEPASPQVQAFREAVAKMTPTAQAKWTPELRATAEAWLDSGGTTGLDGLSETQIKVVGRYLPEEVKVAFEKEQARKTAQRNKLPDHRESSLPPIPSKKTRKLGAKGMELVPAVLDELAKVLPNIRDLVEVRDAQEGEPDAEGFYDPQTDKPVVLANNVFLKDHHAGNEAMALKETIVHELLHRGFAKLRQTNPQLFQQFEAFSITDTNDSLLDSLVRRGYTMYSNWRNDPVQAQKAREEIFVRKAALDVAVNGLDAIKSPTSLASQFFKWFKEFLSKLLGRVPPDNQLVHWTQVFLNAAQAEMGGMQGERMLSTVSGPIRIPLSPSEIDFADWLTGGPMADTYSMEEVLERKVEESELPYIEKKELVLPVEDIARDALYRVSVQMEDMIDDYRDNGATPSQVASARRAARSLSDKIQASLPREGGIRYALGEPPDMQEVKDRLNTFIEDNKATNSFLEAFGPVRVERMQQQGEKLGPEYIVAQVRPLMQRAQSELGFELDEEGNYVLSQRATDKAQSVLVKWLQDGRKFAKAYNKKAEKFYEKLFRGMEEIPVDSDMAAAVLLHEIMSYAKALAASSPKAEDQILLDMVRPQYGSVVLANYDLTMHKTGRTLQTARNYSEGTELGQDAVEKSNAEGEKRAKEELGDEAISSATAEGKAGVEAGVDAAPDLPAGDPTIRLLDLAVESLDDVAKSQSEKLFSLLLRRGRIADALERAKKAGNKALSILTEKTWLEEPLPSTVEELEAEAAKLDEQIGKALADTLKALEGAKPETRKKVKDRAKKAPKSVQSLIDKLSKMPDEAKEAKPRAETLRSVLRDTIKAKDFDDKPIREAADKAGATPEQAERLVEEAKRLHEIGQDKTPSKSKLRSFLLSHPQETLYNPEQRQALVKAFLRNEVGMNDAEIARYLPKFEKNFVKAMEEARKKYLDDLEAKFNAPKKERESRVDAKNRKLLNALRAGLAETKAPRTALLEKLGFQEFKPSDKHVIAKLDAARNKALAEGDLAKANLKKTELESLIRRRRPPMGWLQAMNQAWITSALSSLRNLALNVWTPLGEIMVRYAGALAQAVRNGDFSRLTALNQALAEAFKRMPSRFRFAFRTDTFTQQANAAIAEQASMIDELRRSYGRLQDKNLSNKERAGAGVRFMFAIGDYSRRVLQSIDDTWFTAIQSFVASANLLSDLNKYGVSADALTAASTSFASRAREEARADMQVIDRLSDYLGSLKGKTAEGVRQALELYRMDQTGISPENLALTNELLDVIELLRLRSGAEGDALITRAQKELGNYTRLAAVRAAEKADLETRKWVESVLTEKGVEKPDVDKVLLDAEEGAKKGASYSMGLHRVEDAPALDVGNTFARMIDAGGHAVLKVNPLIGRMMIGFFGIPVNLMNKSLWYAPGYGVARFMLAEWAKKNPQKEFYAYSMANEKERAQRFLEVAVGQTMFLAAWGLGAVRDRDDEETEGLYITLGGPSNRTEKDAWYARGFRPYSICYKSADGTVAAVPYGVGAGEVLKMPLMALGAFEDMRLNKKLGDREDLSSVIEYVNAAAAGIGKQATFLGAKNTLGALAPDTLGTNTMSSVAYAVSNFVPFNGLDRSIAALSVGPPDRSRTGAIIANIPVARWLATDPAINVFGDRWGNKSEKGLDLVWDRAWNQALTPLNITSPLSGQDKRLYEFIGNRLVGPSAPQRGALELRNGYLTEKQWYDYSLYRGQVLKSEMISQLDRLGRMDDDSLSKAIAELSTKATKKAKSRFNYE